MASTSSSNSHSSSSSNSKWRYDVFLSFRGEDTRNTFTDHLYWALDRGNIKTFRDDEELSRGEEISSQLLKAIEASRIAIIVFSKTYAHSRWCLDELVKIMQCEKDKGQKVFPIFYHVEPSEVRNQTGIYGEAFNNHERNADEEKEKIEEWKTALRKAGKLSGFPLHDGSESKFIEEIISEIRRFIPKLVQVGENIVGIDENLKQVKLLIDDKSNEVSMVGIYGIGGIGKTTIAKVIYNDMLDQFQRHSFLENVRERSKDDHGLLQLQEKLLCDILMDKNMKLHNIDEGTKMIKSKCHLEKVLIVLDDVGCPKQLKFLSPSSEWFHRGSIIMATTRNKRCLDVHKAYSSYQAKGLAHDRAMELFSWNAFQQQHPNDNYMDLCNRILCYAKGLPLALVVLGSFLFQRDVDQWESTLYKLKTTPLEDIQKVLRISYDGLDDECKRVFLDIACFFKGYSEEFVTNILEGCKFHPKIGLKILDERCLISISNGLIRMHDLLQEMGRSIVRQKYPENPGKWSRLWECEDIKSVLTKNMGTKNIEGIFLNRTPVEPIQHPAEAFRKMNRLRLLSVGFNVMPLSQDFELPSCITYFRWCRYPFESMPSNFHANNLVELHLQFSNIIHLWEGHMHGGKLKVIDLSYSKYLVDISSISSAPNLEMLILEGCRRLKGLPWNIHKFKSLQTLSCASCLDIKSFPEIEENMGRLREVNFRRTSIIEVPSSIRHLHGLEYLDLSHCKRLRSLSDSICSLGSLQTLSLAGCSELKGFPENNIESLKALESLNLSGCFNLESLPVNIYKLSSLHILEVEGCQKLEAILEMNLQVCLNSLESLRMTCRIIKSGVIWNNNFFSSLKTLNPQWDQREEEILNHFCPLSSLVELSITNSSPFKGETQTDSFHLSSLRISSLRNFHLLKGGILSDIFHMSSLECLCISKCNLVEEGIPSDIWNLSSLRWLSLSNCNLMEGEILNHICHLSSLENLCLEWNLFSCIPDGISQLSNLRVLNLSHCKNLQQIPELPSSLRFLDARGSNSISSSPSFLQFQSLVDWFKSELNQVCSNLNLHGAFLQDAWIYVDDCVFDNPGISIAFPRSSGIHEGISYQSTGTDEVTIELPPNWYENNNDLLGFALCGVYVASANESQAHAHENETDNGSSYESKQKETLVYTCEYACDLRMIQDSHQSEVVGFFSFGSFSSDSFCDDDGISDIAWVMYYPKVAIGKYYHSNQWTHFRASFSGKRRVEGCGICLINAKDYEQMHPSLVQASFSCGNFEDHGSPIEDNNSKAHNKRGPTEQSPVEESLYKRCRGTQD